MRSRTTSLSVLLVLVAAVFAAQRGLELHAACDGYCSVTSGVQGSLVSLAAVLAAGAAVAAGWRGRRVPVLLTALAVGLVAAAPVSYAFDDGCNDHGAMAAIGAALVHQVTTPEAAPGTYMHLQTLMLCGDAPPAR